VREAGGGLHLLLGAGSRVAAARTRLTSWRCVRVRVIP
jgi:hypothetical protein